MILREHHYKQTDATVTIGSGAGKCVGVGCSELIMNCFTQHKKETKRTKKSEIGNKYLFSVNM